MVYNMSMPLMVLVCEYILMLMFNKKTQNTIIDAFFLVVSPYVFIITINNLLMGGIGFYKVSNQVIWIHAIAIFFFFMGTFLGWHLGNNYKLKSYYKKTDLLSVNSVVLIFISSISILIILLDIYRLCAQYGIVGMLKQGDTVDRGYIASHLMILLTPLMILMMDFYFETKKIIYILFCTIMLSLIFLTFIKYHIISAVLSIFIYVVLTRPQYVKKIGISSLVFVLGAFALNYMINFKVNKMQVNDNFYINHMWKYIAGGTINFSNVSNYVVKGQELSLVEWLFSMVLSFPAMILSRFLGVVFNRYHYSTLLPLFFVGMEKLEEQSNVVSLLGAAFAQTNAVSFLIFMFFWGILVQWIFRRAQKNVSIRSKLIASIFLAYNMLSFFSSFFELSMPWETMVLAYLIFIPLNIRFARKKENRR